LGGLLMRYYSARSAQSRAMSLPFQGDDWLPGFNFNVEQWDETLTHLVAT
jgi:hypothetical protein